MRDASLIIWLCRDTPLSRAFDQLPECLLVPGSTLTQLLNFEHICFGQLVEHFMVDDLDLLRLVHLEIVRPLRLIHMNKLWPGEVGVRFSCVTLNLLPLPMGRHLSEDLLDLSSALFSGLVSLPAEPTG